MRGGKIRPVGSTKEPRSRRGYPDGVIGDVLGLLENAQISVWYLAAFPGYAVKKKAGTSSEFESRY